MNARSFDRLTHHAGRGVSRWTSLLALGAAGLAGAFADVESEPASTKGKKNPCTKQKKQRLSGFTVVCTGNPDCLDQGEV